MRLRLRLTRLNELIDASRMSQNHWAIKLGLSRGHWSEIVNGKYPYPSAKTRERMLEVFEVPLEELFEAEQGGAPWGDGDFRRVVADRYLIDEELGQGGMGAVYLARDVRHGRPVAIKVISPEAVSGIGVVQFQREIATVAKLQHPNILPLFDSGDAAGQPFYVMPLVRAGSLRRRLERQGRIPLSEALPIIRGMAAALHRAHGERVLHCDVKPENVLLDGDHAWVMDFGIARRLHEGGGGWRHAAGLDVSAGTPAYVSPEQASGEADIDERSDVYSLGCLVFEMLSGRTPFSGNNTQQIVSSRFIVPPPPLRDFAPEIPEAVQQVIERAMSLPKQQRQASAAEFAAELDVAASASRAEIAVRNAAGALRRRLPVLAPLGGMMRGLNLDVVQSVRALWRVPTMSVAAVLCLGLGIGSATAIFSAVNTALLRPLPFADADQLVTVYRTTPHFDTGPFSAPNFNDLARGTRLLSAMTATSGASMLLSLPEEGVRVSAQRVSANLFTTLGVSALRGRLLQPADGGRNQAKVAVLSAEFWRERLGANDSVVGSRIVLDGESHQVVGILPEGFVVPAGTGLLRAQVWVPLIFSDGQLASRGNNWIRVAGRLAPGATLAAADAELKALIAPITEANPYMRGESVRLVPMREESVRRVRGPLTLLLGAVGFVLLIAASNVASLLLARGVRRRRELAVRAALGARRWAVMRLVLAESFALTGAGVALGLALAWLGVRAIGTLAASYMPHLRGFGIDLRVTGFAILTALLVAVICGLVPAWKAASADPQEALRGGTGGGAGRNQHRLLHALVLGEVALSLVLMVGAGLAMRGFMDLINRTPGFDADHILTLQAQVSPERYGDVGTAAGFLAPAIAAVSAVPGVEAAGAIQLLPYEGWGWNFSVRYEGQPDNDQAARPLMEIRYATPSFFAVTGQRLIAGRLLRDDDGLDSTLFAVVTNEATVRRDFPGLRADEVVGKRIDRGNGFWTIVGIVSDIRNFGPAEEPRPEVYLSYRMPGVRFSEFPMMIRTSGDPGQVIRAVSEALRGVDRGVALARIAPMREVMTDSVGQPRFYLVLLAVFALTALVLAMAGLFGVTSYAVEQRTREIGIRTALGSSPRATVGLIMRDVALMVGGGVVVGLVAAYWLTRLLQNQLYGVSPGDLSTRAAMVLALVAAAVAATVIPAWRAVRVDPLIAIRTE